MSGKFMSGKPDDERIFLLQKILIDFVLTNFQLINFLISKHKPMILHFL